MSLGSPKVRGHQRVSFPLDYYAVGRPQMITIPLSPLLPCMTVITRNVTFLVETKCCINVSVIDTTVMSAHMRVDSNLEIIATTSTLFSFYFLKVFGRALAAYGKENNFSH